MEAVLQHSGCSAHGAVKATVCPYAHNHYSLNTYVCLYLLCISIAYCALFSRYAYSHACYCAAPVRSTYSLSACVIYFVFLDTHRSMCTYLLYFQYIILLLILLLRHPTTYINICYMCISLII
jgi:hypothetical protein